MLSIRKKRRLSGPLSITTVFVEFVSCRLLSSFLFQEGKLVKYKYMSFEYKYMKFGSFDLNTV